MLRIDLMDDENLKEILDKLISGMLPHENYDGKYLGSILEKVTKLIQIDEFSMEYYVLLTALLEINKLSASVKDLVIKLHRDTLHDILSNNIMDVVRKPEVRMRQWLIHQGMEDNLEIETVHEKATQKLYSRTMELYDRCFGLALASEEVLSVFPAYKEAMLRNVGQSSIRAQVEILQGSTKIGRKVYAGSKGWFDYNELVLAEVRVRLSDAEEGYIHITSSEQADKMIEELKNLFDALTYYGIPQLDDETPMLKHRFVILAGNENTGKTMLMTAWIGRMLKDKKKVVVMSGETPRALLYARIAVNYIYLTTGKYVMLSDIHNPPLDRPDICKLISVTRLFLDTSGLLTIVDTFSYLNVFTELQAMYDRIEFDAAFFDHSFAFSGVGDKENLDALAIGLRNFKRAYPVFLCLLSHLSTTAKQLVDKGKRPVSSATKGSSTLSAECDEEFVIIKTPELEKQNLLMLHARKRRGPAIPEGIIIKMNWSVSDYYYDPALQVSVSAQTETYEEALNAIEGMASDDEEYIEDEDDFGYEDEYGLVLD